MRWDILEVIVVVGAIAILTAWFRWGSPIAAKNEPPRKWDDRDDLDPLD
jgi:hypothetical protein